MSNQCLLNQKAASMSLKDGLHMLVANTHGGNGMRSSQCLPGHEGEIQAIEDGYVLDTNLTGGS